VLVSITRQRTSSDLRLNPHLHVVFLDGAYYEQGPQLAWQALGHLQTREVGQVLERVVRRIDKHLRRLGLLEGLDPNAELEDPDDPLAASAVSGQAPPAGPPWRRGLMPLSAAALGYDKRYTAEFPRGGHPGAGRSAQRPPASARRPSKRRQRPSMGGVSNDAKRPPQQAGPTLAKQLACRVQQAPTTEPTASPERRMRFAIPETACCSKSSSATCPHS